MQRFHIPNTYIWTCGLLVAIYINLYGRKQEPNVSILNNLTNKSPRIETRTFRIERNKDGRTYKYDV